MTSITRLFILFIGMAGYGKILLAQTITPAPAFSTAQLAALPRANWITNGGNLFNQRYSPLQQINRSNVARLKAVWRTSLHGSGLNVRDSGQAQPLVYDGVIYIVTGEDDVFAIDVDSGKILWSYKAGLNPKDVVVCCGWVSRGLGMGDGRIYVGRLDAKLVALDQRTGKVDWSVQTRNPRAGYSITGAPLYYNGLVIIGYAGGDMGIRGAVQAFDAKDGHLVWTFHTIPGPGEFGHDTWPKNNDVWKYGGAPIWQTPAIDPKLGLIYFSTGNPGSGLSGAMRAGDNLFSDSIVALDVATGRYRWHFQEVHHDLWDYDAANPVVLFNVRVHGKMRKGLAQASKTGWVYLLDRVTGKPLVGITERPVPQEPRQATAATQPYPKGDALVPQSIDIDPGDYDLVNHGRIFTPFYKKPVFYKPMSAVNWPPSSYDPETGLMYICATDAINGAVVDKDQINAPNFQGMFYNGTWVPAGTQKRGIIAALNVRDNKLVWRRQWTDTGNGSIVTAGGLLFVGRDDGRLTALDKRTGKHLWEFRTDAGVNSTVSTFEYKGEQYVVVLAGGSVFGGPRGDGVWLFSLKGKLLPLPPPPSRQGSASAVKIPAGHVADLGHGKTIYDQSCQYCHGARGEGGGHVGAAHLTKALTVPDIVSVLGTGRNAMPNFSTMLSGADMDDVATYIVRQLVKE